MFKFIFKKRIKCEHEYKYIGEEVPDMMYPSLEKSRNYIFKCEKCENIIAINNYDIIKKIQSDFIELLFEELSKPQKERMRNSSFMDLIWSNYSKDYNVNTILRENLNVNPINLGIKELCIVTDEDILSLKFDIKYTEVSEGFLNRELNEGWSYIIAKNKKGNYITVKKYRFRVEVKDEIRRLDSMYLRKGIKKEHTELRNEAIMNVSKYFGIEVDIENVDL